MGEVLARLALEVDSGSVKAANVNLREMPAAAEGAERSTQKLASTTTAAARSTEDFSKRVQGAIRNLEFERQQMTRSAAEQERFTALRRAGVAASSAEGQAISEHIRKLQEQRAAQKAQAESMKLAQQQASGYAALARQRAAEETAAAQQIAVAKAAEMKAAQALQAQEAAIAARQVAQEAQRRAVVQGVVADLAFERHQLMRNAAERERHSALRRAGVTETSAEGLAITASVRALQAQQAAAAASARSMQSTVVATTAGSGAVGVLTRSLGPLAAAFSASAVAQRVWTAGMKAADMGEQAEQIGLTTDQLQAYRLVAAQSGVQSEQLDAAMSRLTRSMGSAADGGKEQIELFERLGVKILGANGELRKSSDIMPELARGLLGVSSETQRGAMMQELFGRSGMKMVTILEQLAQGNEALVDKAKKQNAVMTGETIAAWDKLGDSLVVAGQQLDTILATIAAPVATTALDEINKVLASTRREIDLIQKGLAWLGSRAGKGVSVEDMQAEAAQVQGRIDQLSTQDRTTGRDALMQREYARLGVLQQGISEKMTAAYQPQVMDAVVVKGARNPTPKGSSGSDPYAKAIESAREYILTKQAETAAVGQTVLAAARLKHEQELLNKAQNDGKTLSAAQVLELKNLAGAMAEADSAFATAKFMDDAVSKSNEFIAAQQIERDTLYMSTEAAMAYRLEKEMLNRATAEGITLSGEQVEKLREIAGAQAAAAEETRRAKEWVDFERETFKGFFADVNQGLREGSTIWDAFGNAAINALNKIADKLISMAAEKLFEQAFGGSSTGGGGLLGSLLGGIGSIFGSGGGGGGGSGFTYAHGAAFHHGNVVPFASGGMVTSPTMFPMSGGRRGVMGEAGPEAIMPLRRGSDGKLGVQMHGGGAANENTTVIVNQTVHVGEFVTTQQFASGMRNVKKSAEEGAQTALINRKKRGGLQDVF